MDHTLHLNIRVVQTNYGLIRGLLTVSILGDLYYSFQGIPYVKAPLGDLRFEVTLQNKLKIVKTISYGNRTLNQ